MRRQSDRPEEPRSIACVRNAHHAVSRNTPLACGLRRPYARPSLPLRPGTPGLRALRRSGEHLECRSGCPCSHGHGTHPCRQRCGARRERRLRRELAGQPAKPYRHHRGRIRRWRTALGEFVGGAACGYALIAGHKVPIVGRVSMDLITADVTDLPAGALAVGDDAILLGAGLTIEDAGFAAGTIGYEILTRLGARFARRYIEAGAES